MLALKQYRYSGRFVREIAIFGQRLDPRYTSSRFESLFRVLEDVIRSFSKFKDSSLYTVI